MSYHRALPLDLTLGQDAMNQLDLRGRAAVVTGGAAGIGFAVAQRLAASGARLALWDRDDAALEQAKSSLAGAALTCALDVADPSAVERATQDTVAALGGIDVLVCSAGITGPNKPTWEYPIEDWKKVFDVNVHGLFYCNRAIVPVMRQKDYGRIVNIASVAGKEGNPNAPAYSASKAAVIGLTKSVAADFIRRGIRCNAICPGTIQSPSLDDRIAIQA